MAAYGRNGGAFHTPTTFWGKAGGIWRAAQFAYGKAAGAWQLSFTAFTGYGTDYTPGTYDVAVPSGARSLSVELYAGGGPGGPGGKVDPDIGPDLGGGGGGSSGRIVNSIAISPSDWGQNIHLVVGLGAANGFGTSTDTTISGLFGLAVGRGATGTGAGNGPGANPGLGGTGGTVSGGNVVSQNGVAGADGQNFSGGDGGTVPGNTGFYGNGGKGGGTQGDNGSPGADGHARFDWG